MQLVASAASRYLLLRQVPVIAASTCCCGKYLLLRQVPVVAAMRLDAPREGRTVDRTLISGAVRGTQHQPQLPLGITECIARLDVCGIYHKTLVRFLDLLADGTT